MTVLLINLVIALVIVGLVLYVADLLPIDGTVKSIIKAVVIVCVVIWLLTALTGYHGLHF